MSGNPHGVGNTVLTLAAEIRKKTGNGREIVTFLQMVATGQPLPVPGGRPQRATLDQRLRALELLLDRGWGKAKEIIELASDSSAETRRARLERLSEAERATLLQLLDLALGAGATPPPAALEVSAAREPDPIEPNGARPPDSPPA